MTSEFFTLVKAKYDGGKWNKTMLRALARAGRITAQEYLAITGEAYA